MITAEAAKAEVLVVESMYDEEVYREFVIRAVAELRVRGWTVTVHVQKPSGEWLPPVAESTRSYETPRLALSEGLARGREIVDSMFR